MDRLRTAVDLVRLRRQLHAPLGRRLLAQQGAADFSGGYVIHLAAGISGFVAAATIGPRIRADREKALPHSLPLVAIGGGIVWLGWNGFNGGDPYFASADAAAAVINTNMATAAALLTWILWDTYVERRQEADVPGGRSTAWS